MGELEFVGARNEVDEIINESTMKWYEHMKQMRLGWRRDSLSM